MAHRYNPHRGETGGTQGVFTFSDGSTDTWTLRRSNRARNIRVKMSPTEGIVIAVPLCGLQSAAHAGRQPGLA